MELSMQLLNSINELLAHIKDVENDTIKLSGDSSIKIASFIEKNKLEVDDDVAEALQYQDIISQQLSATIEAIESVQKSISLFEHSAKNDEVIAIESIGKLQKKLNDSLSKARDKREAFSGKVLAENEVDDGIEFF